jgi:hypothetical protein
MGHHCGAHNITIEGECRRWLVHHVNCQAHRGFWGYIDASAPLRAERADRHAEVLADVLCEGIAPALTELVIEYVGTVQERALREHPWSAANCHAFAEVARRLLDAAASVHAAVGETVASLLPADTPVLAKSLAIKLGARIPLPWDQKLRAIARALQVMGIFMCVVKLLPLGECECLFMVGSEVVLGAVEIRMMALVQDAENDLRVIVDRDDALIGS